MTDLAPILQSWLARGEPAILVTVTAAAGSTPREAGARMLISPSASAGTIGGGRLEYIAIEAARALIERGEAMAALDLPLGPALGQCCGGHVALGLERADAAVLARLADAEQAARAAMPSLYLFGAGHVGKAMAQVLAPLPQRLTWIDSRAEEFPAGIAAPVVIRIAADPRTVVAEAPPGAGYLVLTHSHALDFEITEAVLRRGDALYAGLIGSATKRRRFERWFTARGRDPRLLAGLTCPIGAGLGREKRPELIAIMVAAELLRHQAAAAERPALPWRQQG